MAPKATFAILLASMSVAFNASAGGLLTNTNQHINFLRMVARGASHQIDAVYTNPAGISFMENDGWHFSVNNQSAYQTRTIESTFALYPEADHTRHYKGTASAPILPSLYAAYKKGRLSYMGFFGVTGGGGKASFGTGLPMFDAAAIAGIYSATGGNVTPDQYDLSSSMSGKQFVYGAQLGAAYRFNKHLSASFGFRMNFFTGNYTGFMEATHKLTHQPLAGIELDCDQTGWGVNPIIGIDYELGPLTLSAKYEFKTNLNIENDTKKNTDPDGALADFKDGVNTPGDIPALLAVAVGYRFTPKLRATVEYHFFDDKNAEMSHDKQKLLTRGTNEVLGGVEYDINRVFTVSAGAQYTDYGLSDGFQQNTAFSCDSYSIGFGGQARVSKHVTVNAGYFWTNYTKYHKNVPAGNPGYNGTTLAGSEVLDRTNRVFGVGVDFRF